MSKGSNRRPERDMGSYRRNWDRTFGMRYRLVSEERDSYKPKSGTLIDVFTKEQKGSNGKKAGA